MSDELTMFFVYVTMLISSAFLFRRSPDAAQRIAMLVLAFSFALLAATMLAAVLNGYGQEMRDFLRFLRRTGKELMQTGVIILILRLLWREWICGGPRSR